MSIPTTGISESSPAGSDIIALGDNKIREYKVQNREILEVDHTYPSSGQSATAGTHKKVTLIEQADLGTGATGIPILGAQTVGGVAELVFTTEANADLQITSGQYILGSSIRFANNTSLYAKDAAGTGVVDLIKSNASDQTVLPTATVLNAGAILLESTAPTTIANQGAIYTKNDGDQTELYFREESNGDEIQITNAGKVNQDPGFGSWVDKSSSYGAQQAATDGFVTMYLAMVSVSEGGYTLKGYTDGSADPTTLRVGCDHGGSSGANGYPCSATMPVKKGDYWKVVGASYGNAGSWTITVYWIPMGS
jgi:hypothetical protein